MGLSDGSQGVAEQEDECYGGYIPGIQEALFHTEYLLSTSGVPNEWK